jgi:alpha-methylacyl-CoA racemase
MTAESTQLAPRRGPLTGVRIVELAGIGPAPFACMMLSDMGADVIYVDRPDAPLPDPTSVIHRNRRVVTLDLKKPEDLAQVIALVEQADVFIEGFRAGTTERLGLGPDVLLAKNPRLVYGRMTGWGQTGPLARTAGHDINYLSITGALAAFGPAERPTSPLNLVGDYGGGALYLIVGLLAALLEARSSGKGQVIDCAMSDNVTSMLSLFHGAPMKEQWVEQRESNVLDGGAPFYGTYACKDGKFVAVGPLEPQFYAKLLEVVGASASDPAFSNQYDRTKWPAMREKLAAIFRTRTRDEWAALGASTDACLSPVLTMSEAAAHPQLEARAMFSDLQGHRQPSPAPQFLGTPSAIRGVAEKADPAAVTAAWRATAR